jgi:hypothetical protein
MASALTKITAELPKLRKSNLDTTAACVKLTANYEHTRINADILDRRTTSLEGGHAASHANTHAASDRFEDAMEEGEDEEEEDLNRAAEQDAMALRTEARQQQSTILRRAMAEQKEAAAAAETAKAAEISALKARRQEAQEALDRLEGRLEPHLEDHLEDTNTVRRGEMGPHPVREVGQANLPQVRTDRETLDHLPAQVRNHEGGGTHSKLPYPPKFSGDDGVEVEDIIYAYETYLRGSHIPCTEWAQHCTSLLMGTALKQYIAKARALGERTPSWETFKGVLMTFRNTNGALVARQQIAALRQTGSVREYVLKSKILTTQAGPSTPADAVLRFWSGLKNRDTTFALNPLTGVFWTEEAALQQYALNIELARPHTDRTDQPLPRAAHSTPFRVRKHPWIANKSAFMQGDKSGRGGRTPGGQGQNTRGRYQGQGQGRVDGRAINPLAVRGGVDSKTGSAMACPYCSYLRLHSQNGELLKHSPSSCRNYQRYIEERNKVKNNKTLENMKG